MPDTAILNSGLFSFRSTPRWDDPYFRKSKKPRTDAYGYILLKTYEPVPVHADEELGIVDLDLEKDFWETVGKWSMATRNASNMRDKIYHPSFLNLVAMGKEILPLIFREFNENLKNWIPVLEAIAPRVDKNFQDPIRST
jgi:hypothetical protein